MMKEKIFVMVDVVVFVVIDVDVRVVGLNWLEMIEQVLCNEYLCVVLCDYMVKIVLVLDIDVYVQWVYQVNWVVGS